MCGSECEVMTEGFGGECVRGGGVETSERPEEPAVDGRTSSGDSDCLVSFRGGRFLVGTISGHVHWSSNVSTRQGRFRGGRTLRWVSRHRLQSGFSSSHCGTEKKSDRNYSAMT